MDNERPTKRAKLTMEDMVEELPEMLEALQRGDSIKPMSFYCRRLGKYIVEQDSESNEESESNKDDGDNEAAAFLKALSELSEGIPDVQFGAFFDVTHMTLHIKTTEERELKPQEDKFGNVMLDPETCTFDNIAPLAERAPFGNIAKNETCYDDNVRKAFQIKDFSVECFELDDGHGKKGGLLFEKWLIDRISDSTKYNVMPFCNATDVWIVPHAINVYTEGCHFAEHVDTQRHPDMIGTVTLITNDFEGGEFNVWHPAKRHNKLTLKRRENGGFVGVALRATCPHSVDYVKRGCRVSIIFDVLGTFNFQKARSAKLLALMDNVFKLYPDKTHIGVTLEHMYTKHDIAQKRFRSIHDSTLVETAGDRGKLISLMWTINMHLPGAEDEKSEITENYVSTLNEEDEKTYRDAVFFSATNKPGFAAFKEKQEGASWTGNEAMDGKDNATYLVTVLMIQRT